MDNYNCKTCLYANKLSDRSVKCDKKKLLNGKETIIEKDKVELPCPCHSNRYIKETRYMRKNKDLRQAEDACEVCGRLMNIFNKDNYDYIVEEIIVNGKTEYHTVRKCRICIEKGRMLYE